MKKIYLLFVTVLLVSLLVLAGCNTITGASSSTPVATSAPTATTSAPVTSSMTSLAGMEGTLENIYAQVDPAVVNISVIEKQNSTAGNIPGFFAQPQQQYSEALGSGFFWDNTGDIVTNNHVIANADNITVTFYDGTEVPGTVVGADADSDLAVVKVTVPSNLQIQPVQLADSTQVKVGAAGHCHR